MRFAPFEPPGYVLAEMGPAIIDAQKHSAALELARERGRIHQTDFGGGFQ